MMCFKLLPFGFVSTDLPCRLSLRLRLRSQHGAGSEAAEDSEPVACPGGQIEEKLYLLTCFQHKS